MPSVRLNRVAKSYARSQRAVNDLDLEIRDGELLVLVGPSGCGKSTVLRMIAGLEEISAGEIRIGERVVNDVAPRDRDIAMVFQSYALYPHMTVFENLAFGLRRRKLPAAEIDRRVRGAAATLGLERYLKSLPRQLSGGERQRVALGRAMVREPSVFLFDEPLSNLDAQLRVQMRAEIKRLHQRVKATMIYVTHDQVEAMTLGDRIAILRGGELQQVADPLTLYHRPANVFVAGFIGSPPINLLRAEVGADGAVTLGGRRLEAGSPLGARLAPLKGGAVTLGIRPEDLVVSEAGAAIGAGHALAVEGTVEVCEPLGNETLVYWQTAAGLLVNRSAGVAPPAPGVRATLGAAAGAVHVFDGASGRRLDA